MVDLLCLCDCDCIHARRADSFTGIDMSVCCLSVRLSVCGLECLWLGKVYRCVRVTTICIYAACIVRLDGVVGMGMVGWCVVVSCRSTVPPRCLVLLEDIDGALSPKQVGGVGGNW